MKSKIFKQLLSLAMVAAIFLSMETGVSAQNVSASDTSVAKVVSQSDVMKSTDTREQDALINHELYDKNDSFITSAMVVESGNYLNSSTSQNNTFPSGQVWTFDENTKTMTITGSGDIEMYSSYEFGEEKEKYDNFNNVSIQTKKIIFDEGIENFSQLFNSCLFSNLEIILISSTAYYSAGYYDYSGSIWTSIDFMEYVGECTNLLEINVDSNNPYYKTQDGILFSLDMTTLIAYPPMKEQTDYAIPRSVKTISNAAFSHCHHIANVIIPDSVKVIGNWAFFDCNQLQTANIPDSVTVLGDAAFWKCSQLDNVVIGNGVSELFGTFCGCSNLKNITLPNKLKGIYIGNLLHNDNDVGVFDYCESLKKLSLPKSVEIIEDSFYGCNALKELDVDKDNPNYSSFDGVLYNNDQTALLVCPNGKNGTVIIPNSVTYIDPWTFIDCTALTSIVVDSSSNYYSSQDGLLYDKGKNNLIVCPKGRIDTFIIPNSVTEIGSVAFFNCNSLTNIVIPSSVTKIGEWAFRNCTLLKDVYYTGSQRQWNRMLTDEDGYEIDLGLNDNVTIHYNYVPTALSITSHPANITAKVNDNVSFTVKAQGDGLTYQWYYKKAGQTAWNKWGARTTVTTTATANATWNGMQVYCKVTDKYGNSVDSNSATITIKQDLKITAQPTDKTVKLGESLTLSVKAEGTGLTYQWYYKKSGATSFSKWNGRTHASETVTPNASWNGIQLYCTVKDSSGNSLDSSVAKITVTQDLKITAQPTNKTIKKGDSVTLSLKAEGTGLTYQWYYKKAGATSFSTWNGRTHASETVTPNTTWNGIQLYCVVKDSSGKKVQSNTIKVLFSDVVTIVTQPTNVTAKTGDNVTFKFVAEGVGLTYQWYYKKAGATAWSKWNGRTTASTTATANASWDGMQVYCVVKNSSGSTLNSNIAKITLSDVLAITQQPSNVTTQAGQNVTFTVKAKGVGLKYQWQ